MKRGLPLTGCRPRWVIAVDYEVEGSLQEYEETD